MAVWRIDKLGMRTFHHLYSKDQINSLVQFRQKLHQNPELAFEEVETNRRLIEMASIFLSNMSYEAVAQTGLLIRIPGQSDRIAPVVIRGDMDALPIYEATSLPYASQVPGKMHACGHDVHMSWVMAAGILLAKQPALGPVHLLFQPAEEVALGAKKVIESGLIDDAGAIFGAHVDNRFEIGQVVATEGPISASSDTFTIVLHGKSAHGARPHEGKDPLPAMTHILQSINSMIARELSPSTAAVISVGEIHAGTAHNIIPGQVQIRGTMRAQDAVTRGTLHTALQRIVHHSASATEMAYELDIKRGPAAIINRAPYIDWVQEAISPIVGPDNMLSLPEANLGAEDFSFYLSHLPGCFIRIGSRENGDNYTRAHSPQFVAADAAVFVGGTVLAEIARVASSRL